MALAGQRDAVAEGGCAPSSVNSDNVLAFQVRINERVTPRRSIQEGGSGGELGSVEKGQKTKAGVRGQRWIG